MDGDIAPLPGIVAFAEQYGAIVYADDVHGDGVLGRRGAGIVEHFNLHGQIVIEVGTLSKALGGMGGFLAAKSAITDFLFQRSRPCSFATGHLPPMVAAGMLAALDLLEAGPERIRRLWDNTNPFRTQHNGLGFDTRASATPLIAIMAGTNV
jgi:glycine C-acetyltransferase